MLDKFQPDTPRGDARAQMISSGKAKRIQASRTHTSSEISEKISVAFGTKDFTFLECVRGGNKLIISSNQAMDGRDAIERRGSLYLFRNTNKVKYSNMYCVPLF